MKEEKERDELREQAKAAKFEAESKKQVIKKIEEVQQILGNKEKKDEKKHHHKHHKKESEYKKAIETIKSMADEPAKAAARATQEVEEKLKAETKKEN